MLYYNGVNWGKMNEGLELINLINKHYDYFLMSDLLKYWMKEWKMNARYTMMNIYEKW